MTQNPSLVSPPMAPEDPLENPAPPVFLGRLSISQTPWFETAEQIRAGIEHGRQIAHLLEWVHSQMRLRLTPVERRCIELYYFENLNYRQAAEVLGVNVTSVYRGVRRALRKLRTAAENYPPRPKHARRRPSPQSIRLRGGPR